MFFIPKAYVTTFFHFIIARLFKTDGNIVTNRSSNSTREICSQNLFVNEINSNRKYPILNIIDNRRQLQRESTDDQNNAAKWYKCYDGTQNNWNIYLLIVIVITIIVVIVVNK